MSITSYTYVRETEEKAQHSAQHMNTSMNMVEETERGNETNRIMYLHCIHVRLMLCIYFSFFFVCLSNNVKEILVSSRKHTQNFKTTWLSTFSRSRGPHTKVIFTNHSQLDAIFGRAKFSIEPRCLSKAFTQITRVIEQIDPSVSTRSDVPKNEKKKWRRRRQYNQFLGWKVYLMSVFYSAYLWYPNPLWLVMMIDNVCHMWNAINSNKHSSIQIFRHSRFIAENIRLAVVRAFIYFVLDSHRYSITKW